MARIYPRDPGPDPDRNFGPDNDPSTLRSWLVTLAIVAGMALFGAIGAHCTGARPASVAVQP